MFFTSPKREIFYYCSYLHSVEAIEKVREFEKPAQMKLLIEKEGEKWSLLRRINFYVEWIPRILNEGDMERFRKYYNGFAGDILTYMTINGYDSQYINEIKSKLLTLKKLVENNGYNDNFIITFYSRYKEIVSLLSDYGIYFPIRFYKISYGNFSDSVKKIVGYLDEIERDMLRGQELHVDLTVALEKLAEFIKNYYTDDEKIAFIRDVVVKKIKVLKSKVGAIKTDKSGEKFADLYSETIGVVYDMLSAIENDKLKENIYQKYLGEFLGKPAEEMKESELIKVIEKAIEKNPKFRDKIWDLVKEKIEEIDKEEEESEEFI